VTQWLQYGFSGNLIMRNPGPTYVCRSSGSQGGALNQDINNFTAGSIVAMPVNDASKQVDSAGVVCLPGGTCSVDKYAIVGFGSLLINHAYSGQTALTNCGTPPFAYQSAGNLRCLDTIWKGYQEGGITPQPGGRNFGLVAITLAG
jgi:hypothetical protein